MSQRQRMSPFPNYLSMEAVCREMKQFVGIALRDVILFFQGNIMFAFQPLLSHQRAARLIADRVQKNPRLYAGLIKKQHGYGKNLVNFARQAARQTRRGKASPQQLCDWFTGYAQRYKLVYASYGSVWTMEDELVGDLYALVEKRIKDPLEASNILNTLTKQPLAMVVTRERQALLKMAMSIALHQEWQQAVRAGEWSGIKKYQPLLRLITAHQKKFYWITRDYEDPILTNEKIIERLRQVLAGDVAQEYRQLTDALANDLAARKRYEKELRLTAAERQLFAAMRDAAHLKELRKQYVSSSLYHFDSVLAEIGKHLYLSIKQVRFMHTADVAAALLKGRDLTRALNERMKLSMWHTVDGRDTKVSVGPEAAAMFARFCTVDKNTREFTGMPVSPGLARGPARLVMNPDECDKVQKGDIIVSIQVVPSFSTAIIKSAGMVCDGGHGITSHPATLAREAKIPCVIQTRFAREVVKDGDILEVDGYQGVVRIIDKKDAGR